MPRETLTRGDVVGAAIAVLDEEGYEALSMRHVAQRLGTAAPTLYWHVRNRDELLDLVLDAIAAEVLEGIGQPEGWRAWMTALARSLRAVLLAHRGLGPIIGLRPLTGPNATAALARLLDALRRDGFDEAEAALAATTLTAWASTFAVSEARDLDAAGPPGMPSADDRFEYGLAVMLDGIDAHRLARHDRSGRS